MTAHGPQLVQGGVDRPPVTAQTVLRPQQTKQISHSQSVVGVGILREDLINPEGKDVYGHSGASFS
jgi:hypothetical protein